MAIGAGQVARVVAEGIFDTGDVVQNVFHYVNSGSTGVSNAEFMAVINGFVSDGYDAFDSVMSDQLTINRVIVNNANSGNPVGDEALDTPITGAATGEPLPYQDSALVLFPTEIKRTQGRKFLAGLTVGSVDDGQVVDSTAQGFMATWGAWFLLGFTVAGQAFDLCTFRESDSRIALCASALTRSGVYTQRRRRLSSGA